MSKLLSLIALFATPCWADSLKTMDLSGKLGSIIGSEQACGFSYDQAAIAAWVTKNVDADDMQFAPMLQMIILGTQSDMATKSGSALTAQCAAVGQAARHYGFIKP